MRLYTQNYVGIVRCTWKHEHHNLQRDSSLTPISLYIENVNLDCGVIYSELWVLSDSTWKHEHHNLQSSSLTPIGLIENVNFDPEVVFLKFIQCVAMCDPIKENESHIGFINF